jgi:hypothetical protein
MKRDIENIPPGETICSVCNELKENIEFSFYKNRLTNDGYRLMVNTNCRSCSKIRSKERSDIKKRHKNLKKPEYGSLCECCQKPVYRNWQLDHCHVTGNFRGWICKSCNTGLGSIGDNLQSLYRAVEYLKRANNNENPSQQNYL